MFTVMPGDIRAIFPKISQGKRVAPAPEWKSI
jgi:hypothetical protein